MHENPAEWHILPSRRQRQLDVAALLVASFILFLTLSHVFVWFVLLPLFGIFILWRCPQPDVVIGVGQQGWWLRRDTTKQITQWRVGSIRRREFVCLVWGFWPWQLIRIRPDSLPDMESFRRLKFALYGSV